MGTPPPLQGTSQGTPRPTQRTREKREALTHSKAPPFECLPWEALTHSQQVANSNKWGEHLHFGPTHGQGCLGILTASSKCLGFLTAYPRRRPTPRQYPLRGGQGALRHLPPPTPSQGVMGSLSHPPSASSGETDAPTPLELPSLRNGHACVL